MADIYGRNLKLEIFGGSHDDQIGMTLEGFPPGVAIDKAKLQAFLNRRAPGRNSLSTARKEPDEPIFLSGIDTAGYTDGTPIKAIIQNKNQHSKDYSKLAHIPRPGHADFAAMMKYGEQVDLRGGGHFSGRLTAPLCIAGGLCLQYLEEKYNIKIGAHIYSIGSVRDEAFDPVLIDAETLEQVKARPLPVLDEAKGELMAAQIQKVKEIGDSIGGIVECAAVNIPLGLGEHMFNGAENRIAAIVFGIPAVKGIEFGAGFGCAALKGSENNDSFYTDGKTVRTKTNNCGGILGGMTDGMPIIFRAALKPTPSIYMEQDSVDLAKMENVKFKIEGRHDPCIVPRAVPVFEAALAVALADMLGDGE